ncbi:MAG: SDR family oxidoreductase [Ignavibacteriae bacterium]|nr:SDR family oxidoreductase [Ignavibacteriota bacterium]NOG98346.1 SDR family oxidoreductase [Ignavibacteriota bacterium]
MKNKSVLISGSSTGIGKACALYLDRLGYKVYAGVRKESDAEKLMSESSKNLKPVILDVTDSKSIDNTLREIEADTESEFFGLVNNAGIGISGVLEAVEIEDVRKLMDVNVIGLLALTQKFIPLLKKSKGKIINIGSTSSYLSFPGGSAYAGSKFAVRAITDALRLELNPFGISVTLISPGAVESEIWNKSRSYKEKIRESIDPQILEDYKELIKFGKNILEKIKPIPAIEVAKSVETALSSLQPKRYYYVGSDCKAAAKFSKLPGSLKDKMILKKIKKLGK